MNRRDMFRVIPGGLAAAMLPAEPANEQPKEITVRLPAAMQPGQAFTIVNISPGQVVVFGP